MLKRLFFLLALAIPSYAAGPFQAKRYFENNGGLLDHISPLLIPEKNGSAMMNITMDDRGQLSKRKGSLNQTTASLTNPNTAVTAGGYLNAVSGSPVFITVVGTNVFTTGNTYNGTYTNVTGTVTVTNSSSNLGQVTGLNDRMVVCNDSDKPFYVGGSGTAFALNSTVISAGKTCSTYGSYLIIGNTTESGTAFPNRVRWSDINNPDVLPANNYIDIEPNDGDRIVAIAGYADAMFIFKRHSIYKMYITGLDGADAFLVRPAARNIGAWAKNSVIPVPGAGIFFLSQKTVYLLTGNEFSYGSTSAAGVTYGINLVPVGDPIQRTIDLIQRSQWVNAVGGYLPQRYQYWLSVSTSGTTNSEVLVFDYIQKAWSTYSGMKINMLASAENSSGDYLLISGDYNGFTYQQDNGTVDKPAGVSTAISASYTTGDLTLDAPEFTKGFKYLYIFSQVDTTTTITVNGAFDYSAAFYFTNSLSLGQVGAQYDSAIYDTDIYPALNYKVSRIPLDRVGRAIKLQFVNNDSQGQMGIIGWVLVYTLEDWRGD